MNKKVTIIDYGVGNILSIQNAIRFNGFDPIITSNPELIEKSSHIILPGVGAFPAAMEKLKKLNLIDPIQSFKKKGKFILGICLGMQLLFSRSDESKSDTKGLNILEGSVSKIEIDKYNGIYVPHVGWNSIYESENNDTSLINVNDSKDFYFVNSYHVLPEDRKIIKYYFRHGKEYAAIIRKENIIATQFHPEKSKNGLIILNNFCNLK